MKRFITVARSNGRIIGVVHQLATSAQSAVTAHMAQYGDRTDVVITVA